MATFIKAGFWEKLCKPCKGYKGWLNLDEFVKENSGGPSYKVYTALLTQQGTNPPTAQVLENTLNANISFSYVAKGSYTINIDTVFPGNKTFPWIAFPGCAGNCGSAGIYAQPVDTTSMSIETFDSSYSYSNDTLFDTPIEIRVYP